jgi:hypothetical protein
VADFATEVAAVAENMIDPYYFHGRCRGLAVVACRFAEFQCELPPYLPLASFLLEHRCCLLSRYGIHYHYFFLMKPLACLPADYCASPTRTGNLLANRLHLMNLLESLPHSCPH